MRYDITSSENALATLSNLTNINQNVWKSFKIENIDNIEEYIKEIVANNNGTYAEFYNLEFVFFHITTSEKNCEAIQSQGLLDLRNSYCLKTSELREFLDKNNIYIDFRENTITNLSQTYNLLSQSNLSNYHVKQAHKVGRKLYKDFVINGFVNIDRERPYGGLIHKRPEILENIDNLFGLDLSKKWSEYKYPYIIKAIASFDEIDICCEIEFVNMNNIVPLLSKAYRVAFEEEANNNVIILKQNKQICNKKICSIDEFDSWNRNLITP